MQNRCPCYSGKEYLNCCKPFHDGLPASNALELMRSRYSAYALQLADYIIDTTDPDNPGFQQNRSKWRVDILQFSQQTQFVGLEIIEYIPGRQEAFVTFRASLSQGSKDASFTEKSRFRCKAKIWLYTDAIELIP